MASFVEKTHALSSEIEEQLHHGRDQLLELNSCRKDLAEQLIAQLNDYEHDGALWPYMVDLFDCFGVDTEYHSADCFIVRPSEQLRVSNIPGLSEDGMTKALMPSEVITRPLKRSLINYKSNLVLF